MLCTCKKCKKNFESPKWRKAVYCGRECSGNGQSGKGKITKSCKQCGTDFISDVHKNRKYCSKKCFGLTRRKDKIKKNCVFCDTEFLCRSCTPNVKYCSEDCMGKAFRIREEIKCQTCQTEFYPTKNGMKFCSPECNYASHPQQGYKSVSINTIPKHEQDLFRKMFGKKGSCHEHRIVMARHVGRAIKSTEIVHHKDGVKRNNSIDNLELLESKKDHHTGYGDDIYQELEEAKARIQELEAELGGSGY